MGGFDSCEGSKRFKEQEREVAAVCCWWGTPAGLMRLDVINNGGELWFDVGCLRRNEASSRN